MQLLTILAMLTAAGGVLFALQNHQSVVVSLLFWEFEASLAIVLLLTLSLGGFVVALVSTPSTLRRQWTIGRQQKRIEELELRVETLHKEAAELKRHPPSAEGGLPDASPYKEMPQLIASGSAGEKP